MTGKHIGYKRVSTTDQNPGRQLEGISVDKMFIDYASGKSSDRPQLNLMLEFIREDDLVIVHSMDRLARTLKDLKNLIEDMIKRNIKVQFIKENLIFSNENSAMSMLLLHIMGAFAEFEYAFIRERQREGIEAAKKMNKFKGSPKKLNHEKIQFLKSELHNTRKSKTQIAEELGVSRFTLYRYIDEHNLMEISK